jgi:phage virion morphogenesis protein
MAGVSVIYTDQTVLAVLNRIAQNFTPAGMRPVMKEVGEELAESTKRRFETSTAPDGHHWAPIKPGTVLARHQKMLDYYGDRPLMASGQLFKSVTNKVTRGGAAAEIGVKRPFARGVGPEVHQFGTRNGRIPARPFLGLSDTDRITVLDILQTFIQEHLP